MSKMGSGPRQQRLPYLQRNWLTVVNYWQGTGVGLGGRLEDAGPRVTNGDDEHYQRPAKRRRFAEGSPDSGIGHEIDGFVLHEDPIEPQRSMRIESLTIMHKDEPRVRANGSLGHSVPRTSKDITTIKARCKITITTPSRTLGDSQVLFCDSQICTISTLQKTPGGFRMARVYLQQPFLVPEEKIFVERDDDSVFDLADSYSLKVELESAGDHNWPPLNLEDLVNENDMPMMVPASSAFPILRHWTLRCEFTNILDPGRRSGSLRVRKGSGPSARTDFVTKIDLTWATALPDRHLTKGWQKGSVTPIVNLEQQEEPMPLTNGHVNGQQVNGRMLNGHANGVEEEVEDDAEGELTPSRSLRMRGPTKNYNLKLLSAQAQGREPRKRSRNADLKKSDTDRVIYHLPREATPIKEVVVDGFSCCVCHAPHQSLIQLRAHLISHAQYSFEVNLNAGKSGSLIDISCVAENSGPFLRPKIYQLGKPTKAFDIEKYVEGDDSWATSRLGPNNDDGSVAIARKAHPTKVVASRIVQRPIVRRKEKKIYVPATKQPLFDPLSKAKLTPGTEVRQLVADDGWLIQKHRDIVQDFCDLGSSEKEYIKEWDAFIQKRRISSEAFIGRAVVEFVNEKLSWLVESKSRSQEFGKHLTVLISRGLDDETVKLVQSRLQDARMHQKPVDNAADATSATDTAKAAPHRNSRGCAVCGRAVRGPSLLICANELCKKPLYHDECIRDTALIFTEHPRWRCNDCSN